MANTRRSHSVGRTLRRTRKEHGWTVAAVSEITGVAASTLAKIENDQTSPDVDVLLRLRDRLGMEFGELFHGKRFWWFARDSTTVNRIGDGIRHETRLGEYHLLSEERLKNSFQPMLVRVPKGRHRPEILSRHEGEEFLYVVSGSLWFYMEPYNPILLETSESVHFDSGMPHGFTAASDADAFILAVCQSTRWAGEDT